MTLPDDPVGWLKLCGLLSAGSGSLLLAWRVRVILKWIVFCLVAHEESIKQLKLVAEKKPQTGPIVEGVTKHLLQIQDKLGMILLVSGFGLLGLGMLCNAASYLMPQ